MVPTSYPMLGHIARSLRYYNASSAALLDEITPDKLLLIYGVDTIATSPETKKIMMGVK